MSKRSASRRAGRARRPKTTLHDAPRAALAWPLWLAPVAIVFAAFSIRLVVLMQLAGHPLLQPRGVLDGAVYVKLATRVAAGDLGLAPDVYYLSPFYTYFLGLLFALTGGSVLAARLVQVVLGAAAVGLVMQIATEWFGRRSGLVAGVLAACTGLFAFNEVLILQSSIDPFLAALALFLLTRAVQRGSWRYFAAAGAAFGALSLNRPNALPVVGAIIAVWLAVRRSRQAARECAALALATVLLVAPVTLRNRVVAGEWVLITSHGGLNFYIGNAFGANGTFKAIPGIRPSIEGQKEDARTVAGAALKRKVTAGEASSYFSHLAWQSIQSHPAAWLKVLARKVLLTFHAADVALNYSYTYFVFDEATLLSIVLVGPWLIIPLGLFGLFVGPKVRGHQGPGTKDQGLDLGPYLAWAVFVPVYAATLVAFFVSSRYRLALLVPLVAGAGAALAWLWERATRPASRRALLPGVAVLAVLFVGLNWPIEVDDGRMFEREERIVRYITDGQIAEGKRLLVETEPVHANRAVMLYRVGLAFRDRDLLDDALVCLQRALKANPTEPYIHFNLAEVQMQTGRIAEALPHLQAARSAGIEQVTVTYDFVGAYDALGQRDRARTELASIRISPGMDGKQLLELGAAAMKLDDLWLAERFLRVAIARAPKLASAHEHLGVALGMAGRVSEAVAELETTVRLDATSADAVFHLAVAYAQAARYADARAAAERTLALQPNYPPARDLLSKLPK